MRAIILVAVSVLILAYAASVEASYEYGCCLPDNFDCIAGDEATFVTEAAFQEACEEAQGEGTPTYSSTRSTCVTKCEIGCSCATGNVAGREVINSTESLVRVTKHRHDQRTSATSTYQWKRFSDYPAGSKCVDICGGGTASSTPPAPTYTVKGTVKNSTGTMRDVTITLHAEGTPVSSVKTDSSGQYSTVLPGGKSYLLTAVPPASAPQCEPASLSPFTLTSNKVQDLALRCAAKTGCTNARPSITAPTAVKGTDGAAFTITYDDRCSNFIMFVPFRCEGANCNTGWTALESTTKTTVTDSGLKPQTDYCYYVRADAKGASAESDRRCFKTGDAACMTRPVDSPPSWCGIVADGSAVLSCDDRNILVTNNCVDKACAVIASGPACVQRTPCDKCNGLLGFFAKLGLTIPGGTSQPPIKCVEAKQCYLDRETERPLLIDAYTSCTAVEGCSSYRSQHSCAANRCKVESGTSSSCEWKELQPEIGGGVCVSNDPAVTPPCRQCDEIFGSCTKEMCLQISRSCYFDGPTDAEGKFSNDMEPQGCIPEQDMACRFYDTENDCIGPNNGKPKQAATYDIVYDASDKRIGNTNAHVSSSDLFGFGACEWIASEGRCIKDADNYSPDNEDDCFQDALSDDELALCLRDVTPPTTKLILRPGVLPEYGASEVAKLPVMLTDDLTPPAKVKTYACIVNSGSCYPTTPLANLLVPDEDAVYTLYYYSIDMHHNSEQVKSQRLNVTEDHVPQLQVSIAESQR